MKKNILFSLMLMLICLSSCDNYLDLQPLSQPSSTTFLEDETQVTMGVNACYNYIDANTDGQIYCWYRYLSALEDAAMFRTWGTFNGFRTGAVSPTDGGVSTFYKQFYAGVSRCNIVIDGMEKAKSSMDLAKWNRMRAEARVIRAWCYYNLVVKFGDIPFTRHLLEMSEYAQLKRTPEDTVYTFILTEMDDAVQYLPSVQTTDNKGRITSGAAYAIAAKAAIYRAFFHNGQAIAPDQSYLRKVEDYTQIIINSGAYSLFYDNSDIKNSYKNLFLYQGENSKEVILQKEFNLAQNKSHDADRIMASRNYADGYAAESPQEYLIHSYEDTLGNTVDKSPYYDPRNPFSGREPRFYQTILWPRVDGDQDITVKLDSKILKGYNSVYEGAKYPDAKDKNLMREYKSLHKDWNTGKDLDQYDWYQGSDGKYVIVGNQEATNAYSSRSGYLTWKYWAISDWATNTQGKSSLNFILLRYADILLMNAEARIELNDDLDKAALYINMVRARGWGKTLEQYQVHPSAVSAAIGQSGLKAKVRRERKIELCFEGQRYEDLKRYGAAVKALSVPVVGRPKLFHLESTSHIPQVDENGVVTLPWLQGLALDDKYPNQWWQDSKYQNAYNRWPIPQSEFDNGKALTKEDQNPGY